MNKLKAALLAVAVVLVGNCAPRPALADHAGLNKWGWRRGVAVGVPVIDRVSRPDLVQDAAVKWHSASNGMFVPWIEVSTAPYVTYNCAKQTGYIVFCRDPYMALTQTVFVEKFYTPILNDIGSAVVHVNAQYFEGKSMWYPGVENLIVMKGMGLAAGLSTTWMDTGSVMFAGTPAYSRAYPNAHDIATIRGMYG